MLMVSCQGNCNQLHTEQYNLTNPNRLGPELVQIVKLNGDVNVLFNAHKMAMNIIKVAVRISEGPLNKALSEEIS